METRAFSLLETSIVLLIIGLIIAGITLSSNLIKKSRIASAQTLTQKSPIHNISDSALWLETSFSDRLSSENLEDSSALTSWSETRKALETASVVAVGTGPVYSNTINYIPTVKFDGSESNYLQVEDSSFLNNTDYTIFVVEKRTAQGGNNFFIGDNSNSTTNSSLLLGYNADSQVIHSHSGLAASNISSYSASVTDYQSSKEEPRIFSFVLSSAKGSAVYVNGILAAKDPNNKTQLNNLNGLAIGKGYDGEIGEISVFNRALNNTERKSVEDYLGEKWRSTINRKKGISSSEGAEADVIDCSGYIITREGCEISCAVNIAGISSSPVNNDSSGTFTCNQSGFDSSKTVSYSCNSGVLSTSGSCSCQSGYTYINGQCESNCSINIEGLSTQSLLPASSQTSLSCDQAGYSGSLSYTCSGGQASVTGTCFKKCVTPNNINGIDAGQDVTNASGTLSCNAAQNFTGNVSYTCVNGVFSSTGTCSCASGYNMVSGTCQQPCSSGSTIGINTTTVNAGSGTLNCNATNFSTSDSLNYSCSSGNFVVTSGACDTCASGYTFSSNACRQNCTTPSGITGLNTGTAVNHGSTSVACNTYGYSGTINYTCNNGTFAYSSGSCAENPFVKTGCYQLDSSAANNTVTITAPAGKIFTRIAYADFGTGYTLGNCTTVGSCNAAGAVTQVQNKCIGQSSCTLSYFPDFRTPLGDPCANVVKKVQIELEYQ